MGGTSSSTTSQSASSSPWATGQTAVNGILGQLNPLLASSGLNPTESGAIGQLTANGQAGNPYAGQIGANASGLLSGGGALNQAGTVNQNYQNYQAQTNPLASNTNYDPMQTPGIGTQLAGLTNSITSGINGQFAAAGRDGSPANSQSTAYGLAQGLAPILTGQYNQNVQNQQGAAQNLYNAGNATSGMLSGMQNQYNTNTQQGTQAASDALAAQNYGPNAVLQAQQLGQSIPTQNLGLLSQIGIPIAGLGSQSTGQGTTTNQASGAQQFGQIASGVGNLFGGLFGGSGGGSMANAMKLFS